MSYRLFLDTNILVCAFDQSNPEKRDLAREIMSGGIWIISWQVIQEFSHVALQRFATPMSPTDLKDYPDRVLWPNCEVLPIAGIFRWAVVAHELTQYWFYDSLIVASAMASGANKLLSEDLQHGRQVGDLRIENPCLT